MKFMKIEEFNRRTRVNYDEFSDIASIYSHVASFAYWPSAQESKTGKPLPKDGDAEQYYQPSIINETCFAN